MEGGRLGLKKICLNTKIFPGKFHRQICVNCNAWNLISKEISFPKRFIELILFLTMIEAESMYVSKF